MDHAPVAQRIEQQPSKLSVLGSNPSKGTLNERNIKLLLS